LNAAREEKGQDANGRIPQGNGITKPLKKGVQKANETGGQRDD